MSPATIINNRKALFFIVLFIVAVTFTADVTDLREELRILSCPFSSLDNNVTTGVTSTAVLSPEPIVTACAVQRRTSVEISFIHLLPYGFRAPPFLS